MKRALIPLLLVLLVGLLAGAFWAVRLVWLRPFNIDHFFERAYIEFLWDDPEALTSTGVLVPYRLTGHEALLSDASPQRALELADIGRHNLALLEGYDREDLTQAQQVSYDVFHWFLKTGVAGEPFLFHDYPVTHISGPHLELPQFMMHTHALETKDDAENYLSRLAQVEPKFGQLIDALAYRKDKGIIAPTYILTNAIRQCDEFVAMMPEENPLYTSFVKRLDKGAAFDETLKAKLKQQCKDRIIEHVYPAYKRLSGYLMQLETESMSIAGTWHLPAGDEYYRYCLRQHTTLDLDPEVLYDYGKLEMARIEGEMRILMNLLRYPQDVPVSTILKELSTDRTIIFGSDSAGCAACLAHFQRSVDIIMPQLSKHFNKLPVSLLEVHEVPENRAESSTLAFYLPPKGDPLGAGRMFVNTRKADNLTYFLATTYAYHEGVPGHHLQKAIQVELTDIPQFRRFLPFTAYTEGWAMYAEELGHEIMDTEDPMDRLGLLQSDLFRTARLVTDVGIHHKKWLREQAVSFMQDNAGLSQQEAEDEVDRYIVWPGQGAAYKVGKMKFIELRDRVRKAQGNAYDPKAFHDLVIGHGAMPLEVLEASVDRYIRSLDQPRSLSNK